MSVANRLVESGHYASQQIKQIASQLEQEWKAFAAALDERSTLLDMSAIFHQKAEQVSNTNRANGSGLVSHCLISSCGGFGIRTPFLLWREWRATEVEQVQCWT